MKLMIDRRQLIVTYDTVVAQGLSRKIVLSYTYSNIYIRVFDDDVGALG